MDWYSGLDVTEKIASLIAALLVIGGSLVALFRTYRASKARFSRRITWLGPMVSVIRKSLIRYWKLLLSALSLVVATYLIFKSSNTDPSFAWLITALMILALGFSLWQLPPGRTETDRNPASSRDRTPRPPLPTRPNQLSEIGEWVQPLAGYKPIRLGPSIASGDQYPGITIPFEKPLFSNDAVPFHLSLDRLRGNLQGIEHSPKHATNIERSKEITPGATNVDRLFLLLTSGNALRITDNVEFDGNQIGYVEIFFKDGDTHKEPLMLGRNIRDWSYQNPDVVQSISSPNATQVWRDPSDVATIDMLTIPIPASPQNIQYVQICAQVIGVPANYRGNSQRFD